MHLQVYCQKKDTSRISSLQEACALLVELVSFDIYLSPKTLSPLLIPYIFKRGVEYGHDANLGLKDTSNLAIGRKTVAFDFSSPNIAKEFHAGHLQSTIIGANLANLHADMGWNTVKINYLGDWGKQLGLLAVGWQRFRSEETFKQDPLGHLLDVYVRLDSLRKKKEGAAKEAKGRGEDTALLESQGLYAERNDDFKKMGGR